jgi:hypothetical protein
MAYSTIETSIAGYATGEEILLSSATVFVKDL